MDLLTIQKNLIKAQQDYISALSEQSNVTEMFDNPKNEENNEEETSRNSCSALIIGESVRKLRTQKGLTQTELAEKVGVGQTMIARVEHGAKIPSLPLALDLAKVFGCTVDEMCYGVSIDTKNETTDFSEKLRKLRTDKMLSREQLSKATGISEDSILSYELGRRKPKIEALSAIAEYFGVSVDYLNGNQSR